MAEVLGAQTLVEDARFLTATDRSQHRTALESELNAIFSRASVDSWIEKLSAAGVPATRVYGLEEAVVSDIAQERRTFQDSDGVPLVRLPWLVDDEPIAWTAPAPTLGQHTREVMREIGFSDERIETALAHCAAREA